MSERNGILDKLNPLASLERKAEDRGEIAERKRMVYRQVPMINRVLERLGDLKGSDGEVGFKEGKRRQEEREFLRTLALGFVTTLDIRIGNKSPFEIEYPGYQFVYSSRDHDHLKREGGEIIKDGDMVEWTTVLIDEVVPGFEVRKAIIFQEGRIRLVTAGGG